MKTEVFTKKDKTKGEKYHLEAGDKFVSRFETPRMNKLGKYENWSLGVTMLPAKKDIFVQLTKGQAKKITELGNVQGKTLECYTYKNTYGDQVGIRLATQ